MKETSIQPSLLPYLLPGRGNSYLRFQQAESQKSTINPHLSPFTVINGHDPLARTYRSAFVTDYGSIIKEVNLLIQRSAVRLSTDKETVLTNLMIDRFWQQAMTIRQNRSPEHSILLSVQVGEQGQLLSFAPLFYCKMKSVFFEPPCPDCGHALQLCKDDARLNAAGLPPYSASTRRYLYCPSCKMMNNQQIWYTQERSTDDPLTVQDCKQLISNFDRLDSNSGRNVDLPCLTCRQSNLCYGKEQRAHDTIFILSFYPFYMLITERDSLDGFHFLTMALENQTPPPGVEATISDLIVEDSATVNERKQSDSDPVISILLKNISRRWQKESLQPSSPYEHVSSHEIPTTLPTPTADNERQNDLDTETVLISSSSQQPPEIGETCREETVLLSGDSASNMDAPPHLHTDKETEKNKPKDQEYNLTETVILKPGEKL